MKTVIAGLSVSLLLILFSVANYHPLVDVAVMKDKYSYSESRFIEVNGSAVHYYEKGLGDTLVLLHGNGGNMHHFMPIMDELSKHYRVIVPDYLGHGLTGVNENNDFSNGAFISFFEAFFDKLELDTFHIAGHSMGGYWTLQYAQRHPERISKIVLIDAYGGICADQEYGTFFIPENLPLAETFSSYIFPKFMVRSELQKNVYLPDSISDTLVTTHHDLMSIKGNRMYRKHFFGFDHPRAEIDGSKLDHPIYMLWGEQDSVHNLCEADNLRSRLTVQGVTILKNVGHTPMIENPIETQSTVLGFLAD